MRSSPMRPEAFSFNRAICFLSLPMASSEAVNEEGEEFGEARCFRPSLRFERNRGGEF